MRERKIRFPAETDGRDNQVYEKYGVKMSSGCLPSLVQLLILFGLYPVVQNIPEYVTKVRNVYQPLVEQIQSVSGL